MAITYKVLGQANPQATTDTNLIQVGSGKSMTVSSVTICNTGSTSATYRVAVRPAGESITAKNYVAYDVSIPGNNTDSLTIGITLAETDVLTVRASNTNLAFSAFGSEIA